MDYTKPDFCIPQLDQMPDSCFCLRAGDTRCVPLTCVSSTSKARTSSAVCFLFQFLRCSWRTQTRFICLKTHHIIYLNFFVKRSHIMKKITLSFLTEETVNKKIAFALQLLLLLAPLFRKRAHANINPL